MVEDAIKKVLEMSREEALEEKNKRTLFVVTYNPALPSISGILQKHWLPLDEQKI